MKSFHVHVGVADHDANIRFYSSLFGAEPTVRKTDYAKWMVDEPRLNFAISTSGAHRGVSHLGLEGDSAEELAEILEPRRSRTPPAVTRGPTSIGRPIRRAFNGKASIRAVCWRMRSRLRCGSKPVPAVVVRRPRRSSSR